MDYDERLRLWISPADWIQRSKHWLDDGGLRHVVDSLFWSIALFLVSASMVVVFVFFLSRSIVHQQQAERHVREIPRLIDHRKDGTWRASP